MKFLYRLGAGILFICNLHSITFLRKSTVLPSIFLHFSNANTSALEILTEMIRPTLFFSTLCSFQCSHLHEKGKWEHLYFSMLLTFPAFVARVEG